MSYRERAVEQQQLYFDHLGAREVSEGVEVWVALRSPTEVVRITQTFPASDVIPSLSDIWSGAAWCEREIAEAFNVRFDTPTPLLLLDDESKRGYLLKERTLLAREREWPGSFDPAGKKIKPIGAE